MKKYLSGWPALGQRYGLHARSVQRLVVAGRLPKPVYFQGSNRPMWEIEALEAHERAMVHHTEPAVQPRVNTEPKRPRGRPRKIRATADAETEAA